MIMDDFHYNIVFTYETFLMCSWKCVSIILLESQIAWNQIKSDILLILFLIQTVCNDKSPQYFGIALLSA